MKIGLQEVAEFLGLSAEEVKQWSGKRFITSEQARQILKDFGFSFPQKIVSFQMLKGGVAKTTSAFNLGVRAAQYGAKVLFVDLDQQANLTFALGHSNENDPAWIDIVEKKATVYQTIKKVDSHIDVIPSNLNNSVLDRVLLNSNRQWSMAVKRPLDQIRDNYDLIIIDTAPALSAVNTAVTVASDLVVLPVIPDRFSYLGLQKHLSELEDLRSDFNLKFETKILVTKFDQREKASHEIMERCLSEFPSQMLKSFVRTNSEIKNTIATDKTIFQRQGAAKVDYDMVAREILGGAHA
ncbi:MAG: ParA family protein [Bdellovibrionota bacterium]